MSKRKPNPFPTSALECFKALGDPNRLAILRWMLGREDATTVTEIAEQALALDLSVVSRHLGTLRDAALIRAERRGRQVFYRVDGAAVAKTLHSLAESIEVCCVPAKPASKGAK